MSKVEGGPARRAVKAPRLADGLGYLWIAGNKVFRRLNVKRRGKRRPRPADILLPEGYEAEVLDVRFDEPVHCAFDDQGRCYVTEAGYRTDSPPKIWRVDVTTGQRELVFEIPAEDWKKSGALTGCCWHDGSLYYSYNDHVGRVGPSGAVEKIVTGLPGLGDHQLSPPTFGPDGKLYFSVGSVTNCGVVGPDNVAYEWLRNPEYQEVCEVPGQDLRLTGLNFEMRDVTGRLRDEVRTGGFVPFGTETEPGQVVRGSVKCNTGVLRCNPDGSDLELVAWGLRNSFGLRFHPDGRLFATEHGIDERGVRFIIGDPDDFYEVQEGRWFGYPDYGSGIRLDDPHWGDGGRGRDPLIADPPDPDPPKPFVTFETHAGANGFDFCRDEAFGFPGDAFVALFGDAAPVTTRRSVPAGFKVVRVDMRDRRVADFAVNKIAGGAGVLPHEGFERPVHCEFGPDGSLYVVDWGELVVAVERVGVETRIGTGLLWRIRRTSGPRGERPREPLQLPVNVLRFVVPAAGAGAVGVLVWIVLRWLR